jgi:hypothetical protein
MPRYNHLSLPVGLKPTPLFDYAVFIACPRDMEEQRRELRSFFEMFNRSTARHWGVRFTVVDWESYATAGIGPPQQLITKQTLEAFHSSLALVIGLMGQRFGSPTGESESGTQEELDWAIRSFRDKGFPEVKCFFQKVRTFVSGPEPSEIRVSLAQWERVLAFKKMLCEQEPRILHKEFTDTDDFRRVVIEDVRAWLCDASRPWIQRPILDPYVDRGEIRPVPSPESGPDVALVDVRLFLHSETEAQATYHNQVVANIHSILSGKVHVLHPRPRLSRDATSLLPPAKPEEVRIVQLDEFWMSEDGVPAPFIEIEHPAWEYKDWGKFLSGASLLGSTKGPFFVVPFYGNVGLLAYRKDSGIPLTAARSWSDLAATCADWERQHSTPLADGSLPVFFDFPKATVSNYNCVFLEILLSLGLITDSQQPIDLAKTLGRDLAVEACLAFRTLCRRSYISQTKRAPPLWPIRHFGQGREELVAGAVRIRPDALFSRHWYSTLTDMLSKMAPEERQNVGISPLPGKTSVMGDWYLGIPSSSGWPEIGRTIVKMLTSREAEIDRLQLGVGWPTRRSFYTEGLSDHSGEVPLSPYVSMKADDVRGVFENGVPLSRFRDYVKYASTLSFHLQRILEMADEGHELRSQVSCILQTLQSRSLFLMSGQDLPNIADSNDEPRDCAR